MDLVIQLYLYNWENEENPVRRQAKQTRQTEINECFLRNLHHPCIKTVHVLCESEDVKMYYTHLAKEFQKEMKCIFLNYGKQPSYADLVRYIDQSVPDNTIVCIQNSDIYIDANISCEFLKSTVGDNTFVSLTRHEHTDNEHSICNLSTCPLIWDYQGSHDTFLFRTPVPKSFSYEAVEIPQNVYGAEAVFMKAWKDTGKLLVNPCFEIRIFHRHFQRISFHSYETVANGYLCHINPSAPANRPDIAASLKTIFTD